VLAEAQCAAIAACVRALPSDLELERFPMPTFNVPAVRFISLLQPDEDPREQDERVCPGQDAACQRWEDVGEEYFHRMCVPPVFTE
jgi:hypothetical protein